MRARRFPGLGAWVMLTLSLSFGWASGADAPVESAQVPQVPSSLTLDDALAMALEFSPALDDSSWQMLTAEGREVQANVVPNPQLDVRFQRLGERRGREDVRRRRIVLRQDLELGGKRRRRVDLARIESQLADRDARIRRDELAATVAMEFAEVLGAQRHVELFGELVDYIDKLNSVAIRMVETGSLRRIEMKLIAQRLGLARIQLGRAEGRLATARFALAATWGSSSPDFETVVGDLEQVKPIPSIDVVLELAKASPASERWEKEVARSRAELFLARSGAVPDLEFGLGVAWEDNSSPPDYLLDLEIDVPLFDRNQGNIRSAKSELNRTQSLQQQAEAVDATLVAELYYELSESAARSSILGDEVIPAARANLESFRLGFEGQSEGPDDLLDSRRDLAKLEVERTEALVDYLQRLAELEHVIGQPLAPGD